MSLPQGDLNAEAHTLTTRRSDVDSTLRDEKNRVCGAFAEFVWKRERGAGNRVASEITISGGAGRNRLDERPADWRGRADDAVDLAGNQRRATR